MRFKGIESVNTYEDVTVFWADLLDMPKTVQDEARKLMEMNVKVKDLGCA